MVAAAMASSSTPRILAARIGSTRPSVTTRSSVARAIATYDGSVARFYIDGTEVASRTITGGFGSANTWRIGAYETNPTGFFDGAIDEVRIYHRALEPDWIRAEFENGTNPSFLVVGPEESEP